MEYYYLAYGSNLNVTQMEMRCPTARILGTAVLRDWRLAFRGSKAGAYLTIEPHTGEEVPVAVWEVQEEDVRQLDRYEGWPALYEKRELWVTYRGIATNQRRTVQAFAYVMTGNRPAGVPSNSYVRTCMEGYDYFGFYQWVLLDAYRRTVEDAKRV